MEEWALGQSTRTLMGMEEKERLIKENKKDGQWIRKKKLTASSILKIIKLFHEGEREWSAASDAEENIKDNEGGKERRKKNVTLVLHSGGVQKNCRDKWKKILFSFGFFPYPNQNRISLKAGIYVVCLLVYILRA